jgi:hypothetical protein
MPSAGGSALVLRRSHVRVGRRRSHLAVLLGRRDELEQLVASFDAAATQLGENPSPLSGRQLRAVRRAERHASEALERLEWVIADTPAETREDVALKIRFCAELPGDAKPGNWRAPCSVKEQLLRTIVADLKRLRDRSAG